MTHNKRLVFVHLPKTAGTTITSLLRNQFEKERIFKGRTMIDYNAVGMDELQTYDLLAGHVYFHHVEDLLNDYAFVTILRDPVDRVISLYKFWRNHSDEFFDNPDIHPQIKYGPSIARKNSLIDFLQLDDPFVKQATSNAYCRQLVSKEVYDQFNTISKDEKIDNARWNLARFSITGVLDYVNFFILELCTLLEVQLPIEIRSKNISPKSNDEYWQDHEEEQKIKVLIKESNQLDYALYYYIKHLAFIKVNQYFSDFLQTE